MEGWSRQAKQDRDVLMRIVALLISMASFADRAGGLRGRRRRQLFQLLHYAEAVGCDFIVGLMPASSAAYGEPNRTGDPEVPAGDAARLAASFRVLALLLYTMLQRRFRLPRTMRARGDALYSVVPAINRAVDTAHLAAHDTS